MKYELTRRINLGRFFTGENEPRRFEHEDLRILDGDSMEEVEKEIESKVYEREGYWRAIADQENKSENKKSETKTEKVETKFNNEPGVTSEIPKIFK